MTRAIPELSGGGGRFGQLQALRHDPIRLFRRLRDECGELGKFRLLDRQVVFFTGAEAQEAFFRQTDDVFDPQPTSNELMRPIFGEGVVLHLEGQGEHSRVQVNFAVEGVKWLVAAYAGLEAAG